MDSSKSKSGAEIFKQIYFTFMLMLQLSRDNLKLTYCFSKCAQEHKIL